MKKKVGRNKQRSTKSAVNAENPSASPLQDIDENGVAQSQAIIDEIEERSARNDVGPSHARPRRDAKGCLLLREGQPSIGSKLDDALEKKLCGFIVGGLRFTDAATLCDIDRVTVHRWKQRGLDEPESRYALFLERITKAEATCKALWVARVARSDDFRAQAFLLKAYWPNEFSERTEISGPGGEPLALGASPFNVVVNLSGAEQEFRIVDHTHDETTESLTAPSVPRRGPWPKP